MVVFKKVENLLGSCHVYLYYWFRFAGPASAAKSSGRCATAIEMTLHIDMSLETCFDIIHYPYTIKKKIKEARFDIWKMFKFHRVTILGLLWVMSSYRNGTDDSFIYARSSPYTFEHSLAFV